jgi:shikimate kinase
MHYKLKTSPGIYLVGFMGCGKSTVGRQLAARLGWDFVDLDAAIEQSAGAKINEVFEKAGEAAFRVMEHRALAVETNHARCGEARVVALGGGAFAQARNRENLAGAGVSIWLDCPVEELWQRVSEMGDRPLARDKAAFEALHRQRRQDYEKADFRVAVEGAIPEAVVDAILALSLF